MPEGHNWTLGAGNSAICAKCAVLIDTSIMTTGHPDWPKWTGKTCPGDTVSPPLYWGIPCPSYVVAAGNHVFARPPELQPGAIYYRFKAALSCECGAHKLGYQRGSPGHSSWCPARSK